MRDDIELEGPHKWIKAEPWHCFVARWQDALRI